MQNSKCFPLLGPSLTRRQNISPVVQSEQAFHSSQSTRPHSCISLPYLPGLALSISSSLILTPHSLPPHPLPNVHADTLPVYYLVSRNVSIAARHLPQTSRASQWHQYKPELTFCTDTSCQNMATLHLQRRGGGDLRVQRCERSWDLPDKNCTLVRGWSIGADLSPSGDLLGLSHPFLSLAPVMTASLQIFADTNQS